EVEDACGVDPLLRRLASVPRGQRAVGLPRTSRQLEPARTIATDRQQRDRGRLELRLLREGQLPPVAFDPPDPALRLDRLAQLLVDLAYDRRRRGRVVADRRQSEQIRGELRAVGVKDERPADAERPAEEACLEDDVVARGGLSRRRVR